VLWRIKTKGSKHNIQNQSDNVTYAWGWGYLRFHNIIGQDTVMGIILIQIVFTVNPRLWCGFCFCFFCFRGGAKYLYRLYVKIPVCDNVSGFLWNQFVCSFFIVWSWLNHHWRSHYQEGIVEVQLTNLTQHHCCSSPKPGPGFPIPPSWSFCVSELRWEVQCSCSFCRYIRDWWPLLLSFRNWRWLAF